MVVRIDLTLDCARPTELAEFWKLALGYEDEPPPAPFTTRQEWARHHDPDGADDEDGAWLHDPAGVGPKLSLLQVPEHKTAKNRLHIDVRVSRASGDRWQAIRDTVERLVNAGGTVLAAFPEHHIVMADPEGNEFCVA